MAALREGLGPTQRDGTNAEGLGSAARLLGHSVAAGSVGIAACAEQMVLGWEEYWWRVRRWAC